MAKADSSEPTVAPFSVEELTVQLERMTRERDERIPLDSVGRTGLSAKDLNGALQKLLFRYGPGSEPQRRALEAAIADLKSYQPLLPGI